jgi:hypothetical protein
MNILRRIRTYLKATVMWLYCRDLLSMRVTSYLITKFKLRNV